MRNRSAGAGISGMEARIIELFEKTTLNSTLAPSIPGEYLRQDARRTRESNARTATSSAHFSSRVVKTPPSPTARSAVGRIFRNHMRSGETA
jgi:hypothetical protein